MLLVGGVALVTLAMLPTAAIVISRGLASHPDVRPRATPAPLVIDPQTEPHTCGYHSLASIYRAYRLDPVAENLRYRLGVDIKSLVWKSDSRGTLHPDIFMVAAQDHLSIEPIDPQADDAIARLGDHLATGHPAMVLITRRSTGAMHWVAVDASDGGRLHVIDSLEAAPY